jgi:hypothetical protein
MAKYSGTFQSVALTAYANTTNYGDGLYPFLLQGGTSTQRINVSEIYIGGEATSTSSVAIMKFARDSTVGATVTSGNATLTDASATAPATAAVYGNISTTKPQRNATSALLNLSFNAYGGIVRWVSSPDQMISVVGNTASLGEVSLSAFTGTTATTTIVSGHVLFEVV